MNDRTNLRTPLSRVRHLGSAHAGTGHFWRQRLTSVALIPLTIVFIAIVVALLGRNHAATAQILGSAPVAILMLLFVLTGIYHMWLGMQVIVEDYVHHELVKIVTLMANTFFCAAIGLACVFAVLKLSFGV
ncbi:MAG: succinate dehydrogenase, hydrophobic membrane anchor protein [Pseudorhodoplanes sp.]|nr:succinate dehydrogenase, hydrophobic membrane anchor protein [Pseudorhodoplanes sp.]